MAELGLEPGQVTTASGLIYIYHPKFGMSEVQTIRLEPYLAILQLQPIDSSSVAADGLRRLDFNEFERMGFAIEFRLGDQVNADIIESPQLTWLVDDPDELERFSDEPEFSLPSRPLRSFGSRKRARFSSLSPALEKKPRQSKETRSRGTAKYTCTVCNMEFTNAKLFRRHTTVYNHVGKEKPFNCDTCGKAFRWKEDRDLHFRLYHRQQEKEESTSLEWTDRIRETTMQLPMLQINPIKAFDHAANIIAFEADEMAKQDESKVCNTVPQYCPGPTAAYLVDMTKLNHKDDIVNDSYGSWGHSSSENAFYAINVDEKSLRRLNKGNKRKLIDDTKIDLKVRRRCYWHPQEKQFKKSIFVGFLDDLTIPKWAIVSYEWMCTPYELVNRPHGNAKYKDKPFQPTAKSVRMSLRQRASHLTPKQNVRLVSEQNIEEAVGPAFVPRDDQQAHYQALRERRRANNDN